MPHQAVSKVLAGYFIPQAPTNGGKPMNRKKLVAVAVVAAALTSEGESNDE
jgi:hypothetical protein